MTTESLPPESVDAVKPTPAAPPAHYIDASLIPERALEELGRHMSQADSDKLEAARIAGREAKRAEQQKAKEESAASSKRAADAVKEVIERDAATPDEQQKPDPTGPPVELTVTPMLTAEQTKIAEGYTADMGEIAAEMGMPAEEAQVLLDFVIDGAVQTLEGLDTSNQEECVTHLKSLYGETSGDAIITGAREGFKKLPEGVQAWLDHTTDDGQVLGNHPSVLVMLSLWNGGYSKLSPEQASKELAQQRASKSYMTGDRMTLDKVRLLGMIATRGQGGEMPMPSKVAPAAKSAVQAEIDKIRSDKNYTSIDAKVRAPLVARMNSLMAQLHQG
jgi:hypothetical protein